MRQVEAEGGAGQIADRARKRLLHGSRGQPFAAGQIEFADAEDVAFAVGGNDPAFGDARNQLPGLVQTNQPLDGRGADQLGRRRQPIARGEQFARFADHRDVDRAIAALSAGGERQKQK